MCSLSSSRTYKNQELIQMTKVQNFIGGELVDSVSGGTMPLVDPTTGEEYATPPISNEQDIDNAYAAASKAFADWKRTTPSHRQKALLDFADDVEKNAQALVEAEGRNTGKPTTSRWPKKSLRWSTRSGSSPVRQGCWRASRQANIWRTTPPGSAV